jgi:hypothetical protein
MPTSFGMFRDKELGRPADCLLGFYYSLPRTSLLTPNLFRGGEGGEGNIISFLPAFSVVLNDIQLKNYHKTFHSIASTFRLWTSVSESAMAPSGTATIVSYTGSLPRKYVNLQFCTGNGMVFSVLELSLRIAAHKGFSSTWIISLDPRSYLSFWSSSRNWVCYL